MKGKNEIKKLKGISLFREGKTTIIENNNPQQSVNIFVSGLKELKGLYFNFCLINQDFLQWMSSLKLSGRQFRVLMYLIGKMGFDNEISITYQEIEKNMKIAQPHLSTDLKKLIEKQIIIREKITPGKYRIILNSLKINQGLAYKGDNKNREKVDRHKYLSEKNLPYKRQKNLFGGYDMVDPKSGEVIIYGPSNIQTES